MLNESFSDQNVPDFYQQCFLNNPIINEISNFLFNNQFDELKEATSIASNIHFDYNNSSDFINNTINTSTDSFTGRHLTSSSSSSLFSSVIKIPDRFYMRKARPKSVVKTCESQKRQVRDHDYDSEPNEQFSRASKRPHSDDNNNNSENRLTGGEGEGGSSNSRAYKIFKTTVSCKELARYFELLMDPSIKEFLRRDKCYIISDKYILAMVFLYFKRAHLELREYTKMNFYLALYLANDIEEDLDEYKYEIFPWVLGDNWHCKFRLFLKKRDILLKKMDYRAIVSRKSCEKIMSFAPTHQIWQRNRPENHGGATRSYMLRKFDGINDTNENILPRGPHKPPKECPFCRVNNKNNVQN